MELVRCIKLSNKFGLHARASTRLAQLAKEFDSRVKIAREGSDEEIDGKSILGILTLGAERGQVLRVRVIGEDAEGAMKAILELFDRKFDEE
ncbi:MAG: HPr family phosphocarrier protein [Planctomycetes bacterium]|nr:HPr family phosphocarrier protein [Planctomycetota bacterium]